MSAHMPWLLLSAAIAAALLTRAAGVLLSGRVEPETPLFDWFACVGQALVGGLMVRAVALPSSALAGTAGSPADCIPVSGVRSRPGSRWAPMTKASCKSGPPRGMRATTKILKPPAR